jgi:hypothetical protein
VGLFGVKLPYNPRTADLTRHVRASKRPLNDRIEMAAESGVRASRIEPARSGYGVPHGLVAECNRRISFQLATFPNAHEEALDLMFISHFASMQGAIRFGSHWTVRIDAHYIGGGKIEWSRLTFLQSRKLCASPLKLQEFDPYHRMGMVRLLVTEEKHSGFAQPKLLKYSETSRYRALPLGSEQQNAVHEFSTCYGVGIHYLVYNPSVIPWQIKTPVEQVPSIPVNKLGCRVVPYLGCKQRFRNAVNDRIGIEPD